MQSTSFENYRKIALDIMDKHSIKEPNIIDFFLCPNADNADEIRSFFNKFASSMVKNGTYKHDMRKWYEIRICTAVSSLFVENREHLENYTDEVILRSIANFQSEIARLAQR